MDLTGKVIGNYEVVAEIGHGGMGTVYRARQPSLNRWVAIKTLAPNLAQDEEFVKRFKQEALATAALEHPNIVRIYDHGEFQGVHFIVMEYIAGGNLFALMKKYARPFAPGEAVWIASQIAQALDYAHRRSIVHRDVKPSNILLDAEGRAVLTDLGIARALYEGTRLTRTGMTVGTPEYMAPEQIEGKPPDGRADLYALGVVLYEMLTARLPFQADTPMVLLYKHVHETPTDPRRLNSNVPAKLGAAMQKVLAKNPAKRFATGEQMSAALLASVPAARVRFSAPDETAARIEYAPKDIAMNTAARAGEMGGQFLRATGRVTWRVLQRTLEALVAVVILLVLLGAILSVVFSFFIAQYAQTTLRDYPWDFKQVDPARPYIVSAATFDYTAQMVQQRTFGTVSNATVSFSTPDRVALSAKVLGSSMVLDGTLRVSEGVPQLQIEHLNNYPLPIIDSIIANGINQGIREAWTTAPVRVTRISVSGSTLSVDTARK